MVNTKAFEIMGYQEELRIQELRVKKTRDDKLNRLTQMDKSDSKEQHK